MSLTAEIAVTLLLICLFIHYSGTRFKTGSNARNLAKQLYEQIKDKPVAIFHARYKAFMNRLSKFQFNKFKYLGVGSFKKSSAEVSKGVAKMHSILTTSQLKPFGNILSLCSGRGGWEQALAPRSTVKSILTITYGPTKGKVRHEAHSSKFYEGRDKVEVFYGDAAQFWHSGNFYSERLGDVPLDPNEKFDWLLFDGGESDPNSEKEITRFVKLFDEVVMPAFAEDREPPQGFILKVLVPGCMEMQSRLRKIQDRTGKGALLRASTDLMSTMELYFVSTQKARLTTQTMKIYDVLINNAINDRRPNPREQLPTVVTWDQPNVEGLEIIPPINMEHSILEYAPFVQDMPRQFSHWRSVAIIPAGIPGSSSSRRHPTAFHLLSEVAPCLPSYDSWEMTNTTPHGFMRVFHDKVDTSPVENSPFHQRLFMVYQGLSLHFKSLGFQLTKLSGDDLRASVNRQGGPTFIDHYSSMGELVDDPSVFEILDKYKAALRNGQPLGGVFTGSPKREKKKYGLTKGSRMISYLPLPMRLLEAHLFSNLDALTKPDKLRFGVGGLGLHDLGTRLETQWRQHAVSDDIAGWDTRVSLAMQSMEAWLVDSLIDPNDTDYRTLIRNMFSVYARPHLLIPRTEQHHRSELIVGQGQVMSGRRPTYTLNTISRVAVLLLQIAYVEEIQDCDLIGWVQRVVKADPDWNMCVSGDDAVVLTTVRKARLFAKSWRVTNSLGLIRKDLSLNADTPIRFSLREVEFCSHSYEHISFYDESTGSTVYRWMPTRPTAEILSKSSLYKGPNDPEYQAGWLRAQGLMLLVNYPHMRDVRRVGLAYLAVTPDTVPLQADRPGIFPRPWLTPGHVLEVLNTCHFGESTAYPTPGFHVYQFAHVGYMRLNHEHDHNPSFNDPHMRAWRQFFLRTVVRVAYTAGGDPTTMFHIRLYEASM
uniref:Putative NS5-like protein n=1 Tax=Thrips tabaci associated jingmen-like virus 1 TaxID=2771481 RepID=A0A7H1D357_9FLAV|nr:putative NS5-like protein [Thrips tabaci associated jingmen-like virus 1]